MKPPECVDCLTTGVTAWRPIKTGTRKPRCATHARATRKQAQINAHGRRVEVGYGITSEQYWALYEAQGGTCAICQVATGKTKRLAVDHDHTKGCGHDPKTGCPTCVRGLLCGPCNQLIGRYKPEALIRALNYFYNPPARSLFARFRELDLP